MDFLRHLEEFGNRVEALYPDINRGGCCVFASLVGQHLEHFFPTRVRVGDNMYNEDINAVRPNIKQNTVKEWNANGVYFGHVILELDVDGKSIHFDTTGIIDAGPTMTLNCFDIMPGHLSVQEATELAAHQDGWNKSFNRRHIRTIKGMVTKFFKKHNSALQTLRSSGLFDRHHFA
jgi:hypothetical protein